MDKIIGLLTNFTDEELKIIMEKVNRREKLYNYEVSLIYHFMRWYEIKQKENNLKWKI